jgi:glycosyltransferase involved in cell wall biosynthesis
MRCLHLHSGNLFGGVETVLLTLAEGQSYATDWQFEYAFAFEGPVVQRLREQPLAIHLLPGVRTSRPWTIWQSRGALQRLLAQVKYDLVMCHSVWALAIYGPVIRQAGVKLVYWQHDWLDGKHWLQRWARRTVPDRIIVNSEFNRASTANVYPLEPTLMYYPVPQKISASLPDRASTRKACETDADAAVIIQVSRMEAWKGHQLRLEALAKLPQDKHWVCWFVGGAQRPAEAEYLARLQAYAQSAGISERLRWLGQRSDIPALLAAADIFCQPNLSGEPFGITYIEALRASLPVVATAIGGAKEIVTPECGLLTPPGDAAALATALERLIASPALRRELGLGGPHRAFSLCDVPTQMAKLAQILTDTVNRK